MSEETATDHTSQFSLDFARREGLRVVLPRRNQLQIDIDNDADYARFTQAYDMLSRMSIVRGFSEAPSRNGGEGRHITIELFNPVTVVERIALQAILGSDWKREAFSYARYTEGEAVPTLFFEKANDTQPKEYPSVNQQD